MDNLRGGTRCGRPELETFHGKDTLDRLPPMVERKIKEAPVNGHKQTVTAQGAKASDGSFRSHVYVGPEWI
jgi:hypothetical protein